MPDNVLIAQLKGENAAAFQLVYKFYFPSIAFFVKQNNGSRADAEDIFQEAMLVLIQKVRNADFVLTSSLKTYLYSIAKNLWLKRLRDNKLIILDEFEHSQLESETFEVELTPEVSKDKKIQHWLTKITTNCQRILTAIFLHQEPMDALMKKMGWKNKHTAANQQYKCIQQVKKSKGKRRGHLNSS